MARPPPLPSQRAPESSRMSAPPFEPSARVLVVDDSATICKVVGNILYLHGRTGIYLEPAPGEAGVNNILSMAREGLNHFTTSAAVTAAATAAAFSICGRPSQRLAVRAW